MLPVLYTLMGLVMFNSSWVQAASCEDAFYEDLTHKLAPHGLELHPHATFANLIPLEIRDELYLGRLIYDSRERLYLAVKPITHESAKTKIRALIQFAARSLQAELTMFRESRYEGASSLGDGRYAVMRGDNLYLVGPSGADWRTQIPGGPLSLASWTAPLHDNNRYLIAHINQDKELQTDGDLFALPDLAGRRTTRVWMLPDPDPTGYLPVTIIRRDVRFGLDASVAGQSWRALDIKLQHTITNQDDIADLIDEHLEQAFDHNPTPLTSQSYARDTRPLPTSEHIVRMRLEGRELIGPDYVFSEELDEHTRVTIATQEKVNRELSQLFFAEWHEGEFEIQTVGDLADMLKSAGFNSYEEFLFAYKWVLERELLSSGSALYSDLGAGVKYAIKHRSLKHYVAMLQMPKEFSRLINAPDNRDELTNFKQDAMKRMVGKIVAAFNIPIVDFYAFLEARLATSREKTILGFFRELVAEINPASRFQEFEFQLFWDRNGFDAYFD